MVMNSSENTSTTVLNFSRDDLLKSLREGVVDIKFTKKDGSERLMKCTLQEGVVVPYERKTDRVVDRTDNNIAVWDVEADGWRSINFDTIKEVNANGVG